jgi:hypothetical protein
VPGNSARPFSNQSLRLHRLPLRYLDRGHQSAIPDDPPVLTTIPARETPQIAAGEDGSLASLGRRGTRSLLLGRPRSRRLHLRERQRTHVHLTRLSLTRAIATTRDPLGITMVEAPSPSGPTQARPSSLPARRDESRRWDSPNRRSASPERGCAVGTRRRPCGAARSRGRVRATAARGFTNVPGGWGT